MTKIVSANQLLAQIRALSLTHSEAVNLVGLLRPYLEAKFFGGEADDFLEKLDRSQAEKLKILDLTGLNQKNLAETLKSLETGIRQTATLALLLPFEPTGAQRRELKNFLQKKLAGGFLLDLKLDPSLIAGPLLIYKGLAKDYSVRQKLETRQEELAELFRHL